MAKDKNIADNSLTYANFTAIILRLTLAAKRFFEIVHQKIAPKDSKSAFEMLQIVNEEKKKQEEQGNYQEEAWVDGNNDAFIVNPLQGFFKYLNLPHEKQELAA